MTSEQLAAEVEAAIRRTTGRVLGVGQAEYDDGSGVQKFERLPISDLVRWAREESDDLIVYGTMLGVRLSRLAEALDLIEARSAGLVA